MLAASLALTAPAVTAHDGETHGAAKPALVTGDAAVEVEVLDLDLVDRNGKPVKFKSEALADRIVAIDFIYATCTTVCPLLSSVFANVQDLLGERLGKEVWFVSITIDPTRDTPRRMDAYARKFADGPGWIWLTGRKKTVDRVLAGLDAYSPEIVEHPPMVLIGDAKRGVWTRLYGIPSPDDILARLDAFAAARSNTTLKLGD
jgi:cytochrome oxidase Cu insertion factor (SCO1/SenC/PrrC family)